MAKQFPKTIQVTRENEGTSDEYLTVNETDNIEDGQQVATYQLVETGRMSVKRTITRIYTADKSERV